jgi:hypothetical protein
METDRRTNGLLYFGMGNTVPGPCEEDEEEEEEEEEE